MLTRRTLLSATPAMPLALATTPAASTPQERIAFHVVGLREAMAEAAPEANSPWHFVMFGIGKQETFQAATGFPSIPGDTRDG